MAPRTPNATSRKNSAVVRTISKKRSRNIIDNNNRNQTVSFDPEDHGQVQTRSDDHEDDDLPSTSASTETEAVIRKAKLSEGIKMARDIIPQFDGTNMSIIMFEEHCKLAATFVEPDELNYLIMLIKMRILDPARKHIQNKVGLTLDELLKTLRRIYAPKSDISQLSQELANVKRKLDENITDYGARVQEILNKITNKVLEKNPGRKGEERCQEYRENAIRNFIRGLDRETLSFMRDKNPATLDLAIEIAIEADIENNSWDMVHNKEKKVSNFEVTKRIDRRAYPIKQVAHFKTNPENKNETGEFSSSIRCFNCNEIGHRKRDCTKLKREEIVKSGEREVKCAYCGRKRHQVKYCKLKKRHEEEIDRASRGESNLHPGNLNLRREQLQGELAPVNKSSIPQQ